MGYEREVLYEMVDCQRYTVMILYDHRFLLILRSYSPLWQLEFATNLPFRAILNVSVRH